MKLSPVALVLASLAAPAANAWPVIDQLVPVGGLPIRVYPDHANKKAYWYIPQSIEPWKRDEQFRSSLFKSPTSLSFVFRGQASVEESMLRQVAEALGTTVKDLSPIAYEYSRNFVCQNIYGDDPKLKWLFPKMIGNYLEIVPVSLRTTDPSLIEEIDYHLTQGGGLACTVEVGFKGVSTAYKLEVLADLNQIYNRFEAAAHGGGLWWEVDIRTLVQSLARDHTITFRSLEDASLPQSELDKKIQASMDEVVKQITSALFRPAMRLPEEPMAGRGKPWSLRVDYRRSSEHARWSATLDSDKVTLKDTQISLRMSVK